MPRFHTHEWDLLPINAFRPTGFGGFRKMTLEGGKGSAPDPNPGMLASAEAAKEVAQMQRELGQEYLQFAKDQYNDYAPFLKNIMGQEADIAKANKERADEYAQYERETYRPLEKSIVRDALDYNQEAKKEQMAQQAMADINTQATNARSQLTRQMARYGINPADGRFAAMNQALGANQAANAAAAGTNARNQAEQLGYAKKLDAAGMGRNLAGNASTAYGVSLNAGNQAANTSMAGGNNLGNAYGATNAMYGGAANSYGTAGNIYGQEFQGRMQGYKAEQEASGALWSGIGSAVGGWASGGFKFGKADGGSIHHGIGPVSGEGGPVDDKIPAMLSNGEYVIPADTVKKVGIARLDKLIAETHTPAAVQRKNKTRKNKKRGIQVKEA